MQLRPTPPQLVLLAAGLGSRFGGLKQLAPVGPAGAILMDYTVADAAAAGIGRLVVVLRPELEAEFRALRGEIYAERFEVRYAFQQAVGGRTRPWGTGHALLAAREVVDGPFLVANADDYYGRRNLARLVDFLQDADTTADATASDWAMVGFPLAATLSDFGPVSRSLCSLDSRSFLRGLHERKDLQASSPEVQENPLVSMNLWALRPDFFPFLEGRFAHFFGRYHGDPQAELYLPHTIAEAIDEGQATVRVFPAEDGWFGITYPDDLVWVQEGLAARAERGDTLPAWMLRTS